MASFNPLTAYAEDHQWVEGIEGCIHTSRKADQSTDDTAVGQGAVQNVMQSDYASSAAQLGITPQDAIVSYWKDDAADDDPKPNDRLTFDLYTYMIKSVIKRRWGPIWDCACVRIT